MLDAAHHRRTELRLNELARRHFSRFPGVFHVDLKDIAAIGRGDMAAGETVLQKLFDGHMVAPRSVAVSGLRALGDGSVSAGRKILKKFISDAQQAHGYQQGGDDHGIYGHGKKAPVSKTEADYTDHGTQQEHCAICRHYLNRNSCEIVTGHVRPQGWCKYFSKEAA
jgi:hypothetical protein